MHSDLRNLAAQQADIVAAWQLRNCGWSWGKVKHHSRSRGWRRIHPGVYALNVSPLSRMQLWWAATLTAPDSFLSHGSGGACFDFYRFDKPFEVVTRPGQGGRRRHGGVVVCRSTSLDGEVTTWDGIPITTAARVLVDIAPGLNEKRMGRAFREAIRLKRTTARRVLTCVERHSGSRLLRDLAVRYASIPYQRTRSDAEALALEILHDAGVPPPLVNVRIAGEEADLVWVELKLIIEIDGPQYHRFREEDARKEALWREAGYTVRRISSDAIYDTPAALVELASRSR